jgi:chromosome segregation ATPase
MAELDSRVFIELITGIVNPVNANMTRHAEAMQTILAAVQRIADIVQAEPTRRTILEQMREELARLAEEYASSLKEHDKQCERRGGQWNAEDVRRAEDVLRQAIDAIEDHFGKHQNQTETHLTPVKDLRDKFDKLIWQISVAYKLAAGFGVAFLGVLIWLVSQYGWPKIGG